MTVHHYADRWHRFHLKSTEVYTVSLSGIEFETEEGTVRLEAKTPGELWDTLQSACEAVIALDEGA